MLSRSEYRGGEPLKILTEKKFDECASSNPSIKIRLIFSRLNIFYNIKAKNQIKKFSDDTANRHLYLAGRLSVSLPQYLLLILDSLT